MFKSRMSSGVHEVVLDIYSVILHNIISKNEAKLMDNLGLYAWGLFPFSQMHL